MSTEQGEQKRTLTNNSKSSAGFFNMKWPKGNKEGKIPSSPKGENNEKDEEETSIIKSLGEICKIILNDMKGLLKNVNDSGGNGFMECARRAASVTAQLDEAVRKLSVYEITFAHNKDVLLFIRQIDENAQIVKSGMVILIKAIKNSDAMTTDNFEETIKKTVTDLANSVKIISNHLSQILKLTKDSFGKRTGEKSKQFLKGIGDKIGDKLETFVLGDKNANSSTNNNNNHGVSPLKIDPSAVVSHNLETATPSEITQEITRVIVNLLELVHKNRSNPDPSYISQFGNLTSKEKLLWKKLQSRAQKIPSLQIEEQHISTIQEVFQKQVRAAFFERSDSLDNTLLIEAKIRYTESLWWFTRMIYPSSYELNSPLAKSRSIRTGFHSLEGVSSSPPTTHIQFNNDKPNRLYCTLCLPLSDVSKTVILEDDDTLSSFCNRYFEKFYLERFPNLKANQFILKIPGIPTYLENSEELLRNNPFVAEILLKKEKPELIFVEKIQTNPVSSLFELIENAEKEKLPFTNENVIAYKGTVPEMIKQFESHCNEHLASLVFNFKLDSEKIKELFLNDKIDRSKEVLTNTLNDNLKDIWKNCGDIIETTFDQYRGLRQVGDFRGVADVGSTIMKEITTINKTLKKTISSTQILFFEQAQRDNLEKVDLSPFQTASQQLLKEFYSFKTGVLNEIQYVSSLRIQEEKSLNLNCLFARKLLTDIIETGYQHVKLLKKLFDDKENEIDVYLPCEISKKIFSKFWGRSAFDMLVQKELSNIMPWIESWAEPIILATLQQEIFGKNKDELQETLENNNIQMIKGLNGSLEGKVSEPIIKLESLFKEIEDEFELLTFSSGKN